VQLQAFPDAQHQTPSSPTNSPKVYWIDEPTETVAPPLGAWTAPAGETNTDVSSAATVHWINSPPSPVPSIDDSRPIYRVSDLPDLPRSLATPSSTPQQTPTSNESIR
jgi:hypothetical protein